MKNKNVLIKKILELKNSNIKSVVESRILELESNFKYNNKILSELFFCILTANFDAEKTIKIQNNIGNCFFECSLNDIKKSLKEQGYRFPNIRGEFIFLARKKFYENIKEEFNFKNIKILIDTFYEVKGSVFLREFFVDNVKGFSYKEASHFLRNIGFKEYSIVDFHIIDLLKEYTFLSEDFGVYTSGKNKGKRKSLSKKDYFFVENILKNIGLKTNLDLSRLDFYLWYLETGKILK